MGVGVFLEGQKVEPTTFMACKETTIPLTNVSCKLYPSHTILNLVTLVIVEKYKLI